MEYLKDDKQDYYCEFARPYINRQIYNDTYNPKKALRRGTLFPELDLIESNNYNDWLYANPKNRVRAKKGGSMC
ncbi:spore coat associated protein CotJA [Clostridioides sp. ZZV15-6597]|uniref:spore coat associated protein CotJA n=1 Tax=Clostridioides sp. ZZV15-6597 TaxID=2811500 RepID=UPI001D117DFD|nr:spore coat associated protein CotJA [Clostridioides sp. ZZV15-6597]